MRNPLVRKSARSAALLAALLLLPLAGIQAQTTKLVGVVNVNLANAEQLQLLPGVGPARAAAIIDYRKQHGPFRQIGDLEQVSGIGEKALGRMKPHCSVSGKTTARMSGPDS